MSLKIHYAGHLNAIPTLAASAFTRPNYGNMPGGRTSTTITADTADGALGGFVAKVSGNNEVDIYDGRGTIVGIFLNNANDAAFENTPAVASGKLTYVHSMGSYSTNLYETETEAGGQMAAYAAGDYLYASNFGLLTKEDTGSIVVAVVTKAPTANDPWMTFNLRV